MPELPEVETIKLGLERKIIGQKLAQIQVLNNNSFSGNIAAIKNQEVIHVWRRAKILGVDLTEGVSLLIHLKMSGQLILVSGQDKFFGGHPTSDIMLQMPNKSTRVIFEFKNGAKLYFNDIRKFGWIKQVKTQDIQDLSFIKFLGPEPLTDSFNWQILKTNLLRRPKTAIKIALLDQTVLSGVGNIYASEALFLAKILPKRLVGTLTDAEFKRLFKGIRKTLEQGIKYGGSTRANFVNAAGEKGDFLSYAFVYNRASEDCKRCGSAILKINQARRGTYFCPVCQK